MEKILTVALVTASELFRRRIFLVPVAYLGFLLVWLGMQAGAISNFREQLANTELIMLATRISMSESIRYLEIIGVLVFTALLSNLVPADRDRGLLEFYLTQPLDTAQYALGKFLGGMMVVILTMVLSLCVMFGYSWRLWGGVDPGLFQATMLSLMRVMMIGQLAFLLSLWWKAIPSFLGAYALFHGPVIVRLLLPRAGDWEGVLRPTLWFTPSFDWFLGGRMAISFGLMVWEDFFLAMLYAITFMAALHMVVIPQWRGLDQP